MQSVWSNSLEDFKIRNTLTCDLTTRMDRDGGNLAETWLQLLYQLSFLEIINLNKFLSSNKEHLLTWMECCGNRKAWQFTERMVRVLFRELMQQYSSCIAYIGIKVYNWMGRLKLWYHWSWIFNVTMHVNIPTSGEVPHLKRKRKPEQMEIKQNQQDMIHKGYQLAQLWWSNLPCNATPHLTRPKQEIN